MQKNIFFFLFFTSTLFAQTDTIFQIHGHRGYRGMFPENTLTAFKEAARAGFYAIELDVFISKDSQVFVSHEPWFSHLTCSYPNGKSVKKFHQHNLYKLNYDSIKQYDCGKRGNKKFPKQIPSAEYKPLLSEVIETMELYCKENNLPPIHYNIEIKSRKIGDDKYHPKPTKIAKLLNSVLKKYAIDDRLLIQSFDTRSLNEMYKLKPHIRYGLLIVNLKSVNKNLSRLDFLPYMYNPNVKLIKEKMVKQVHRKGIKIIAWTVNKKKDYNKIRKIGADGIITDFIDWE